MKSKIQVKKLCRKNFVKENYLSRESAPAEVVSSHYIELDSEGCILAVELVKGALLYSHTQMQTWIPTYQ